MEGCASRTPVRVVYCTPQYPPPGGNYTTLLQVYLGLFTFKRLLIPAFEEVCGYFQHCGCTVLVLRNLEAILGQSGILMEFSC